MALFRQPLYCPFCGELIKEIHDKQEGVPWMMKKIGDNFIGYEPHHCEKTGKTEEYFEHDPELEAWLKGRDSKQLLLP